MKADQPARYQLKLPYSSMEENPEIPPQKPREDPEKNREKKSEQPELPAIEVTSKPPVEHMEPVKTTEPLIIPVITASVQPEIMETHHHPHVHHSKKWKDYLFEFIMLFLAVTAGFFVENQREHYIENKRAVQYSKQLLSDLRLDSAFFENRSKELQNKQVGHERLAKLLTQEGNPGDREILEALLPLTFVFDLPVTTTTYNQMKTSGSLRYIHNEELTAKLQNYYDVLLPRCVKLTDAGLGFFNQYIGPFYIQHIRIQDYDPYNDTLRNKSPVITNRNAQTNQELANIMGNFQTLLKIQAETMNDPALNKIKEVIEILKKEYALD